MTTTTEAERGKFKEILRAKPSWAGLIGSDFVDLLCSYVGQKGAATIFEAERLHQENFLPTALNRDSIMARAEGESYIPAMPIPFEMQVSIKNEGANSCYVPYRSEIETEDGIRLVVESGGTIASQATETRKVKQLSKEILTFTTTGEVFEEFILGGIDEQGIFTIVEFSVEIDGIVWENRQNFRNAESDSTVYHAIYFLTDELAIRLGNGDTGYMPDPGTIVKITVWHTKGDRAYVMADQNLRQVTELMDMDGEPAQLKITSGDYVRKGLAQEDMESIRKHTLSQIQQGTVTARNSDYEYNIQREFPEICYLKVWGESEHIKEHGYNLDYINKAFFAFLIENEGQTAEYANDIIELFENIIRPMNLVPENISLTKQTFQIDIQGKVDRTYDASDVESALTALLLGQFGLYKNTNGKLNVSDIYAVIQAAGYFRDTQPHINRVNKPYFKVTLSGTSEATFFDKYVYLNDVTFGDDEDGDYLGYVDNI